jgi:ADP-heptose:LPS heptosyltransferase
MLTAAIRDLHACKPGEFITDVRTSAPDLWSNNPHLTPLSGENGVETLRCHYPLIHQSNQRPYHFLHGFMEFLSERLQCRVVPTAFRGDIHLRPEEKVLPEHLSALLDPDEPFWIVAAGGKFDFTIKWWETARYQEVVNRLQGIVKFVQIGEGGHHHPPLEKVVDLRGKTTLRDLVRLMYHAQGVLCPVTLAMHLAAAVETKPGGPPNRPCVVIAGGREPPHWEAYPFHQFLHTVGMLRCCRDGGCWCSRAVPLGDGDPKDRRGLCKDVIGTLPRCMHMITADDVVKAILKYFEGGILPTPLSSSN